MRTGLLEPDSLLEQLESVNDQLLSFSAADLADISKAIELRAQLVSRAGHLLRSAGNPNVLKAYRQGLEKAVDAGDVAVQRLLSLRQTISSTNQRMNRLQPAKTASVEWVFSCDM